MDIFAAGKWRGKSYTTRDLDRIVSNFRENKSRIPIVIGHDESQEFLERSDLPAAGWISRLWRRGKHLFADVQHVPPAVARLLRSKAYRTVSAEIYDEPPEGTVGKGKMLRRIAFLGGEIPHVKTLADIPTPENHSEQFDTNKRFLFRFKTQSVKRMKNGSFVTFSEVVMPTREELLKTLAERGMDTSMIDASVPDAVLAEMVRVLTTQPEPEPTEDMEEDKEDVQSNDSDETEDMEEDESCDKRKKPMPTGFSEKKIQDLVSAAVERALAGSVKKDIATLKKFSEEQTASSKKVILDSWIEAQSKAGRIMPRELDAADPANLRNRLMRADGKTVVEKFKEKGKTVELTELDLQMREIEKRPPFKFSERIPAGKVQDSGDGEKDKVIAHYEQFAERFTKLGTSKEDMVKAFESSVKRRPGLTAEAFLSNK